MKNKLIGFESGLWSEYLGEYGNVKEWVEILFGEKNPVEPIVKLNKFKQNETDKYRVAFDNLCENLWAGMKFHPATYISLPYICVLLENKYTDRDWTFLIFQAAGLIIATETKQEQEIPAELSKTYRESKEIILRKGIEFITRNIDYIKAKSNFDRIEMYIGILALMGKSKLAYSFIMSMPWEKANVKCPYCGEKMILNMKDIMLTEYAENVEKIKMAINIMEILEDKELLEKFEKYYEQCTCDKCKNKFMINDGVQENFVK
ncbi:hypothetical protein IX317_001805 [Fusobacterium sp. DD29]|uniref:hypothetical protein n=1 Tax=unclassified Fusobacterium TaxID=2648384 RepID=UPI001B8C24C5|nr:MULTISPECIES: hypothetical protein [unclassified Fusobacterium]MBR8701532.1 hypothetical protein [Fusobacterium sp. DD45]MBR8711269.1 hypothetical protein [Fusobacterium sp. DD28]MBR8750122.1 hypothetical protein [Fusobacterium sp. DD29]MBR8751818.1 hypothetical protein [Fusobacterium sp. DD26]MBR8762353.1 hypothetical protein [Fusobacterium sp. DD25]